MKHGASRRMSYAMQVLVERDSAITKRSCEPKSTCTKKQRKHNHFCHAAHQKQYGFGFRFSTQHGLGVPKP